MGVKEKESPGKQLGFGYVSTGALCYLSILTAHQRIPIVGLSPLSPGDHPFLIYIPQDTGMGTCPKYSQLLYPFSLNQWLVQEVDITFLVVICWHSAFDFFLWDLNSGVSPWGNAFVCIALPQVLVSFLASDPLNGPSLLVCFSFFGLWYSPLQHLTNYKDK